MQNCIYLLLNIHYFFLGTVYCIKIIHYCIIVFMVGHFHVNLDSGYFFSKIKLINLVKLSDPNAFDSYLLQRSRFYGFSL